MKYTCILCPRKCGASRTVDGNDGGYCGMPSLPVVARAALHFGEEPCISGTRGSGTVFFSGCSLHCRFCQNAKISHQEFGRIITVERLCYIFKELEQAGAHNINLVNPTHFAYSIRKALELYKPRIPVIYNSGGYENVKTLKSLEGLIDVYLPDCKYISPRLSKQLSDAEDYYLYAEKAILEMARQSGPVTLDKDGIILRGTIVRHLVLPAHTKETIAVLEQLARYKDQYWISLMFQYTPMGNIQGIKGLDRTLTQRECDKVIDYMVSVGITEGYVQERSSAGVQMIPNFDMTGV